jgi:hypothetical protein
MGPFYRPMSTWASMGRGKINREEMISISLPLESLALLKRLSLLSVCNIILMAKSGMEKITR